MGDEDYRLDDAVGFLLRRANQRHLSVFGAVIPEVTTTQLAALARLFELGPMSQNQLGRVTAMDAATIKGVVGRLVNRRLVATVPSAEDRRRLIVDLTPEGRALFEGLRARARIESSACTERHRSIGRARSPSIMPPPWPRASTTRSGAWSSASRAFAAKC